MALIVVSIGLQVAAGVLALRLVRVTGVGTSWLLVAVGFWGMAARRALSLHRVFDLGALTVYDLEFEVLGLLTSSCMLAGVWLIGPVFRSLRSARDRAEEVAREREALAGSLQEALANIRVLSGLLPICASCKAIRDGSGLWHPLESYVRDHTDADFTHGICPGCAERLYPGLAGGKPR